MSDALERSGKITFAAGKIEYRSGIHGWSLPSTEVRLIGEYTNENGPWLDDYFLVFLASSDGAWNQASFYATGRDEVLAELGQVLGTKLDLGLCNSANFKSRIIWPPNLAGKKFVEAVPSGSEFGKFRQRWLGASFDIRLTECAMLAFR